LVIGYSIQFSQEKSKNTMLILDANGKECKLDIVRQEHAATTPEHSPILP
jgi:hypothetical protein